jgi:hypothetical protein
MKLSDARKVTIKKNVRIRFRLANGLECVLNEHGLAQVPELRGVPDFNLEEEFARADQFILEPVIAAGKPKEKFQPQTLTREQLIRMTASGAPADSAQEEPE